MRASDGTHSADATVTVTVTDEAEAPAFAESSYAFDLAENADGSADRVSLGTVTASDPDGDTLAYSLAAGNNAGLFAVDSSTGEVFYTGAGEDFEAGTGPYAFTVRANDGTHSADATVTVTVTDVQGSAEPAGGDLPAGRATSGEVAVDEEAVTGTLGSASDRDWFAVTLAPGRTYGFSVESDATGAAAPQIRGLRDSDGNPVSGVTGGAEVRFTTDAGGTESTYYIEVGGAAGAVLGNGAGGALGIRSVGVRSVADVGARYRLKAYEVTTQQTATEVEIGESVRDEVTYFDYYDWFEVELEAGKTYRFDMMGSSTSDGTLYDPEIVGVYDADSTWMPGTFDDNGGYNLNSRVYFTPDTGGTYYVKTEPSWHIYEGRYTFSVNEVDADLAADTTTSGTVAVGGSVTGELERTGDRDWFAVSLEAGKTYWLEIRGVSSGGDVLRFPQVFGLYDAAGAKVESSLAQTAGAGGYYASYRVTFTPSVQGTYHVDVGDGGYNYHRIYLYMGGYRLSVQETEGQDYASGTGTSGTVEVGVPVGGVIGQSGDRDWYKVTLEAETTYRFDMERHPTFDSTVDDPEIFGIYDAGAVLLDNTSDDDGGILTNSRVYFTPAAAGTYYAYSSRNRSPIPLHSDH